jgi:hypothetical protein
MRFQHPQEMIIPEHRHQIPADECHRNLPSTSRDAGGEMPHSSVSHSDRSGTVFAK